VRRPYLGDKAMEWFIDSGHSNFQLDTRCGGYSRNRDYLLVYLVLR
jgi:hypothetical protein